MSVFSLLARGLGGYCGSVACLFFLLLGVGGLGGLCWGFWGLFLFYFFVRFVFFVVVFCGVFFGDVLDIIFVISLLPFCLKINFSVSYSVYITLYISLFIYLSLFNLSVAYSVGICI